MAAYWQNEFYQPHQAEALRRLIRQCYPPEYDLPEFWHWRYESHPRFRGKLCIARVGSELLGVQAVAVFDGAYRHEPIKIGMLTSAMTHPQHRRRGIFRSLVAQAVEYAFQAGAAVVFTMPNESSFAAFMRMGGWRTPGLRPFWVRALNLRHLGRAALGRTMLADALSAIPQALLAGRIGRAGDRWHVEPVAHWPAEASAVFERFVASYPGLILRRDAEYLNWRYADNPLWDYLMLLARDEQGRPAGFIVAVAEKRFGLQIGYIVDMLAAPDGDYLGELIRSALARLNERGIHAVGTTTTEPGQFRDLARAGFLRPPGWLVPKRFYLVYRVRPDLAGAMVRLRNLDEWFLTFGDWDTL